MKKPENVIETEEYVEPHCFENDQEASLFYSYLEQEKYIAHLESEVLKLSQHIVSECGHCKSKDTIDYVYCKDCLEFTPK